MNGNNLANRFRKLEKAVHSRDPQDDIPLIIEVHCMRRKSMDSEEDDFMIKEQYQTISLHGSLERKKRW
jgi:hypothetical protein